MLVLNPVLILNEFPLYYIYYKSYTMTSRCFYRDNIGRFNFVVLFLLLFHCFGPSTTNVRVTYEKLVLVVVCIIVVSSRRIRRRKSLSSIPRFAYRSAIKRRQSPVLHFVPLLHLYTITIPR